MKLYVFQGRWFGLRQRGSLPGSARGCSESWGLRTPSDEAQHFMGGPWLHRGLWNCGGCKNLVRVKSFWICSDHKRIQTQGKWTWGGPGSVQPWCVMWPHCGLGSEHPTHGHFAPYMTLPQQLLSDMSKQVFESSIGYALTASTGYAEPFTFVET